MNIYDEILKQCAEIDQQLERFKQPFDIGQWNFATNGHIAAYISKDLCAETYSGNCPTSKPLEPLDKVDTEREPLKLNTKDFALPKETSVVPLLECSACNGNKKCLCLCGHRHTCGICDGKGAVEGILYTWFHGAGYQYKYLALIFNTANKLTNGDFQHFPTTSDTKQPALFRVGNVDFVLMPTTLGQEQCVNFEGKETA